MIFIIVFFYAYYLLKTKNAGTFTLRFTLLPILVCYTMHSWISSCLRPTFSRTPTSVSLSDSSAHHASPQPDEITLGTGISLPGAFSSLHAFSIAIASAVVWNVTISFNSFFLMSILPLPIL